MITLAVLLIANAAGAYITLPMVLGAVWVDTLAWLSIFAYLKDE